MSNFREMTRKGSAMAPEKISNFKNMIEGA